jgi:hypothetical protein
MEKIFIDPFGREKIGICLLFKGKTGIIYSTQCGGLSTIEKVIEGYLVPLGEKEIEDAIFNFFMKEFGENCYPPHNNWTNERIEALNLILKNIPVSFEDANGNDEQDIIEFDKENKSECIEAWIPIVCKKGRGFLTLKNSD